jgi:hypothetical protein
VDLAVLADLAEPVPAVPADLAQWRVLAVPVVGAAEVAVQVAVGQGVEAAAAAAAGVAVVPSGSIAS